MHPISGSPLVHHFEFDAFGLDGPAEASVAAIDAQFELLLELCPGRGCVCAEMMSVKKGDPLGQSGGHLMLHLPVQGAHQENPCS